MYYFLIIKRMIHIMYECMNVYVCTRVYGEVKSIYLGGARAVEVRLVTLQRGRARRRPLPPSLFSQQHAKEIGFPGL